VRRDELRFDVRRERENLFEKESAHQKKRKQQKDYSDEKKIVFSFEHK
jgi:hypothetical protein